MRYVIMANGQGVRWGNYGGRPKHLIEINGESLLGRLVRQLGELDDGAEIIISSSNTAYEVPGARRHAPAVNLIELDRFPPELIVERVCFLYGDTYYSDTALQAIIGTPVDDLGFFGDARAIVAVVVADADLMRYHLGRVRSLYESGEIGSCVGWQVYQSYAGLPFGRGTPGEKFHMVYEPTAGFNTPAEYERFKAELAGVHFAELP